MSDRDVLDMDLEDEENEEKLLNETNDTNDTKDIEGLVFVMGVFNVIYKPKLSSKWSFFVLKVSINRPLPLYNYPCQSPTL